MFHSADSEQPRYNVADLQVLSAHEAVRKHPAMYLGSTDSRSLQRLLQLAVEGLLWHYRFLEEAPDQITVQLTSHGSATVISSKATALPLFLEQSALLLREEVSRMWIEQSRPFLPLRGTNAMSELCVVNALSNYLHVDVCGGKNHRRSFQFKQGVVLRDEEQPLLPDQEHDISLRFWPDFTILDPATFDYEQVQEAMHSVAKGFPSIPLTVTDVAKGAERL